MAPGVAVISALLKGKREREGKKKKKKLTRDELILIPHRANVLIKPFPQFKPKWVM